jgi:cytosine/adenosine deaminase-related metal-dependent hydrolase
MGLNKRKSSRQASADRLADGCPYRPHVLSHADVLVTGETIAAIGPALPVPDGTAEIDAAGGIVMPGMVDTHRHMWQTAMRATEPTGL